MMDQMPPRDPDAKLGDSRYFKDECMAFRHLMGQRDFWADEESAERAKDAIVYVYMNTEHGDDLEGNATLLQVMMDHYITCLVHLPEIEAQHKADEERTR